MLKFIEYKGFDHAFQYWGPWVWWLIGAYLSLPVLVYIIFPMFVSNYSTQRTRKRIIIMVLGDLGHSPRMCYHAKSFAQLDYTVDLCGYLETQPPTEILDDINIEIREIEVLKNTKDLPYIVYAAYKIFFQCFNILKLLYDLRGSENIMIQNPPSMPLLFIIVLFLKTMNRRTKLIIDWHNLNYTILNMKFKNLNHPLVKFLKLYECYFAKFAALHITVTKNMKTFLKDEFGIKNKIIVLHDRPAVQFKPCTNEQKENLLKTNSLFKDVESLSEHKILVSSTSFTEDEDFSVLLRALKKYEENLLSEAKRKTPPILLIVTGKGPLKSHFLEMVKQLKFSSNIIVKTAWLASEDYPKILSVADLGISLHTSSSGIDLPMKIVDMFGCGIPVISLNFKSIHELVRDSENGLVVHDDNEMYRALVDVFSDVKLHSKIKEGAMKESKVRWDDNWDKNLYGTFKYN